MAKQRFERNKPHVNVGTIGHVDHGKTTLTWGFVRSNFFLAMAGVMLPSLGRRPLGPARTEADAFRRSSYISL